MYKPHNGNTEPKGFGKCSIQISYFSLINKVTVSGHIGIMVPDVYKACERFQKLGVNFVKKPDDGKMKGIAFITDPDGYWIEIFNNETVSEIIKNF